MKHTLSGGTGQRRDDARAVYGLPLCNHCKKREAAPDRKRCRPCLDRAAAQAKRRYARLKKERQCTHCGQHAALPGESRCRVCAAVHRTEEGNAYPWPRRVISWLIETYGGFTFGPYPSEIEAHADATMRRIERRYGEFEVYSFVEVEGTPDMNDVRTPRSGEV